MAVCLIDVRCLQDPAYSERGVGRHARAMLQHAGEMLPDARLIGLADPKLGALDAADRALLHGVRHTAYTGELRTPSCLVQLSPMTHDPLFVARLVHHPEVPGAAAVYDFIPFQSPQLYFKTAQARVDYHVSLRWLARHQVFMPISAAAAEGLRDILGVAPGRMVVTGAPLVAAFEDIGTGAGRHVLVVGGGDARKNPECAIRGHARSPGLQARRVPIVVTGGYGAAWLAEQRRVVGILGGDPLLVEAPGHVEAPALLALYADAVCVVCPSRAEGFSLPVVEAMAAGVPVLASDIAAHRALLSEGMFGAEDDLGLSRLLQQMMEPAWRERALARQAEVWPRFRARAVAERFWGAVRRLAPGRAAAVAGRRPRVALLTPLPPDHSGVADYSAATCAPLGAAVELHVFTPTKDAMRPEGAVSVSALSALPFVSSRFDRTVCVIGNSNFHLGILKHLLRYGGAAIQHDGRLLDLYAIHIGLEETVAMAELELGRRLHPNEIWHWLNGDLPPKALIMADLAAAAEPLMMHSKAAIAEIERRYGQKAHHLPFSLYRHVPEAALGAGPREAARRRLGIGAGEVLIASFGSVHPTKAPVDCLWALDVLRSWGVPARLHFVGSTMMEVGPLERLIGELGLEGQVRLGGAYQDEQVYQDHLVGADVGLQLRTSGVGSLSGALADCIAAGLPSVASASLADGMDAPDYVRSVPDSPSPVLVAEAAVGVLAGRPTGESRRAYVASHGFDSYAKALCGALGLG